VASLRASDPRCGPFCACGNAKYRYSARCRRCADRHRWNNPPERTAPELVPGPLEIGYAAGFYEGEGSSDCHSGSLRVTLPQKDIQPLRFIRQYFGGSIGAPDATGISYLYLSGKRAWDFLVLIGPLLSDRRLDQLAAACAKVAYFEGEEVTLCGKALGRFDCSMVGRKSL
jgi:hypothetical protein